MPIIIKNISTNNENEVQKYSVSINNDVVCEFTHMRKDGLAECLAKASKAVELKKLAYIAEMLGVL